MFYTFASAPGGPPSQRNPKRVKVSQACNYCRQHRVRCDDGSPCSRCVANGIECVLSAPLPRQQERVRITEDDSLSTRGTALNSAPGSASPSAPPSKPEAMDSTVGFMSKISAFCSAISQLSSNDSPPPYTSPYRHLPLDVNNGSTTTLRKSQVVHLLDLYWTRCHPYAPILSRPDVDSLCHTLWATNASELQGAPLTDGVIALCLHHLDCSGLNRRLLGLHQEQADSSLAYFQRCLAVTSQYAAFAEPSLERVQCYVLMTLYLLEAGQHHAAYNMIGLALRIAHALNLHRGLPETERNAVLARRIWWTILHLDFRCARLLGRPVGVQLAETTCPLPETGEYAYHTSAMCLTWATLAVTEAMSRHPSQPHDDLITQAESRASTLSKEMYRLREWRDSHLHPAVRRPLHVENKGACGWIDAVADASPSQLLQGVLLELQYYDEIISLHRPFICFPNKSLIPQRSPHADTHATTALDHAMATVDMTHRIMSTTDVLYGRSEVYQWQWNALLTLIGFLMAYPLCHYSPKARQHVQLALEIFSAADAKNTVAVRAASMTRSLCAKVDSLVQMLTPEGHHALSPNAEKTGECGRDNPSSQIDQSHPDSDALWSWTDMTNPDVWSAYSDEITEVLADFPDLPFSNPDGLPN